jgi:hypothetical protein
MSLIGVTCSLKSVETITEPLDENLGREQFRPRRGQLKSEREAVEPLTELRDRFRCGDFRPHRLGSLAKQHHGVGADERRKVELRLALYAQRLPARGDKAQGGSGCRELSRADGQRPGEGARRCRRWLVNPSMEQQSRDSPSLHAFCTRF